MNSDAANMAMIRASHRDSKRLFRNLSVASIIHSSIDTKLTWTEGGTGGILMVRCDVKSVWERGEHGSDLTSESCWHPVSKAAKYKPEMIMSIHFNESSYTRFHNT